MSAAKKQSTALAEMAPPQQTAMTAPAQPQGQLEGLEGTDSGDTILPRLQIMQPVSQAVTLHGERAGVFRSNVSGEAWPELTIVPIAVRKGRTWFREGDQQPACKSHDARIPAPDIDHPPSQTCARVVNGRLEAVCPMAKWGPNKTVPACRERYQLLAVALSPDGEMPFVIGLHGRSVKPVRQLITRLNQLRTPPYGVTCTMRLVKQQNTQGVFYVVDFHGVAKVSPPDLYRGWYLSLKQRDVADEPAAAQPDEYLEREPGAEG